jgi:hypothetical protein
VVPGAVHEELEAFLGRARRGEALPVGQWIFIPLSRIIGLVILRNEGAGARRRPADGIQ